MAALLQATVGAQDVSTAVVAAVTMCQVIWGGYSVVGKWVVEQDVDPLVFAFVRDLISSPILLLLAWLLEARRRRRTPGAALETLGGASSVAGGANAAGLANAGDVRAEPAWLRSVSAGLPAPEDRSTFVLLGVLVCGNQLGYILGVSLTTPTNASLIQPTVPIITAVLSSWMGIEAMRIHTLPGKLRIAGVLSAVAGAVAVVALTHSSTGFGRNAVLGNLFLLGNCTCDSLYVLLQKRLTARYAPVTTTAFAYVVSTFSVYCAIMITPDPTVQGRWSLPVAVHSSLLYAVLLNSVLVYSVISWANKNTSPTVVTAFYPLQVISAAAISALVLGTHLTAAELLGAVLVIGGLFCVVASHRLDETSTSGLKS